MAEQEARVQAIREVHDREKERLLRGRQELQQQVYGHQVCASLTHSYGKKKLVRSNVTEFSLIYFFRCRNLQEFLLARENSDLKHFFPALIRCFIFYRLPTERCKDSCAEVVNIKLLINL